MSSSGPVGALKSARLGLTPNWLRRSLLVVLLGLGLALMNYLAPLQSLSVIFDLALVAIIFGLISMIRPLRFLDIRSRRIAAWIIVAGLSAAIIALLWPARLYRVSDTSSRIDQLMPEYHLNEFHSEMVHASPDRVYQAMKDTTFAEVKMFATLMQLRRAAGGNFNRVRFGQVSMLQAMTRTGSGFVLLSEDPPHEVVFGTGGRFWSTGADQHVITREDLIAYHEAGAAKSVFNIRVEDAGAGWSRLTTETRVLGNDDAGRKKMAAYWRVIYPGSATIRRMWLRAIKSRAEKNEQPVTR